MNPLYQLYLYLFNQKFTFNFFTRYVHKIIEFFTSWMIPEWRLQFRDWGKVAGRQIWKVRRLRRSSHLIFGTNWRTDKSEWIGVLSWCMSCPTATLKNTFMVLMKQKLNRKKYSHWHWIKTVLRFLVVEMRDWPFVSMSYPQFRHSWFVKRSQANVHSIFLLLFCYQTGTNFARALCLFLIKVSWYEPIKIQISFASS